MGEFDLNKLVDKEDADDLALVMAFNISVALALGFVIGRIYQIRSDELERRVKPPRTAYIQLSKAEARRIAVNIA